MAAKNINFSIEDISFKANNHVALLDILSNKTIYEDTAAFLKMSFSNSVSVLPDDETFTTGPEVAPLEAPQYTGALPIERIMEPTSDNPSNIADDPSGSSQAQAMDQEEEEYDMAMDVKLILPVVETPERGEIRSNAPRAEVDAVVACDIPTSSEAAIVEDVDAIPRDDDLPITSTPIAGNGGDEDDEEDDEESDELDLPDSGNDPDGDDDDDDEDDITIQFQRPTTATKGVTLKDSASQGKQMEEESAPEKNQDRKSKGKGVAEEGNLKVLL
ncbi:centromere-binding protein 1-like [Cynara cardunculus var. scolymus]|uniref:centromere-binding protein 1-like n=1 Tax=Cynara cardunculus var. scolymus TaxID=59895 RepID=UPI000D62C71A|nr:centromere-binding protein 1-like [Cynara cardunculus var. scolymus]